MGENTFSVEEESIARSRHNNNTFRWLKPPHILNSSHPLSFSDVDINCWDETEQRLQKRWISNWWPAILRPVHCSQAPLRKTTSILSVQPRHVDNFQSAFQNAIEYAYADPSGILLHLAASLGDTIHSSLLKSLRALATVTNIYEMLPNTTVSLEVTSQPLYKAPWAQEAEIQAEEWTMMQKTTRLPFSALSMDWASTFSCIVFLESGSLNIPPSSFVNVMALSAQDSLFVAAPLLCDPSEKPASFEIRRIRGNVGKPGIAMLIPPNNPQVREIEYEDWHLVTHEPFDGQTSDSFHQTSLHLSFTGCIFPIDTQSYGKRDIEIYFLESVVSVHDKGQWIADLDILASLQSPKFLRLNTICSYDPSLEAVIIQNSDFTMVDTWSEILDRPDNASIIRSTGNWIGRLATTSLSLQMGFDTIIGSEKFCWMCVKTAWMNHKGRKIEGTCENDVMERLESTSDIPPQVANDNSVHLRTVEEALDLKKRRKAVEQERKVMNEMRNTFIIC